ncbi:MAG: tRNA (adenosine(37)-N6)-threonylcarbamoyltransferase complex transferase subunit TsaD [Hyphomicrobiales bacterium]
MICLGLESSCDDTAAAIVRRNPDGSSDILSNIIHTQTDVHAPFGGVVPELAARAHIEYMDHMVTQALQEANLTYNDLNLVAATSGPGLLGGVIIGLMSGKAISLAHDLPFIAVNHLEGHALTAGLSDGIQAPYLLLLISGGHTQILQVNAIGDYQLLGTTIDDAIGEAFDKVAKLLGLGYPGGPHVEAYAKTGSADRFTLPRPMKGRKNCDFSFSGLKTAVLHAAKKIEPIAEQDKHDICAAFQAAAADVLADRVKRAMVLFRENLNLTPESPQNLIIAGGVAANKAIAQKLTELGANHGFNLVVPPSNLCTDNGAMIAWAGITQYMQGNVNNLTAPPRARWPLYE